MRLLLTGVDDDGRSYLVSSDEVVTQPVPTMPEIRNAPLFATTECPPAPRPPSDAKNVDTRLPAGILRWSVVEHAPHDEEADETESAALHTTDAIDLVYVLEGDFRLVLDDGVHPVGTGDCVVMAGVAHGMKAGPHGSKALVAKIGMVPLA
jgi:hypothetical protein